MAEQADIADIIKRSGSLYEEEKLSEAFDLLTPFADGDTDNPELLWQLVRMYYDKSDAAADKKEAKRLAGKGVEISKRALELGSGNFLCWMWAGVILSTHSDLLGNKEALRTSSQVKSYFDKALELNPEDMDVNHLIGRWHFEVASIPGAAILMYSDVPSSSYQEALPYLETAEKHNQEEYIGNWLLLGKTHLQLKNKVEAKKWLTKVMEHGGSNKEAKESKEEAERLLRKL